MTPLAAGTEAPAIRISDADFQRFRDFFYRKTGIWFEDNRRYFVDKRLVERIRATGHDSFRSYFTMVRFQASGEELQELINIMTVNETYFFREEYQFDCLVNSVLPEVLRNRRPDTPVRILCMPCSTGEEPYSIAIKLVEEWDAIDEVDVELVGTDIDTTVLERARQGIYTKRSVQHVPPALLEKYFDPLPGNHWQLKEFMRECVDFRRANVTDAADMKRFRGFDVVFCRNLLIYFDDRSRREAAENLFGVMNPGGFIFLGHSESMSRISSLFKVRRFPEAIVYQRPL